MTAVLQPLIIAQQSRLVALMILLISATFFEGVAEAKKLPSFLNKRKSYTPLLFFKMPLGLSPECDALEKSVRQLEKELDVKVERLDILRSPEAAVLLSLITQRSAPFLYHRESLQSIHVPTAEAPGGSKTTSKNGSGATTIPAYIDKDRLRAWAKGRYLPTAKLETPRRGKPPTVISQDSSALDQEELLEDMALTPLQRKGKEAIKERTEAKAEERKAKK